MVMVFQETYHSDPQGATPWRSDSMISIQPLELSVRERARQYVDQFNHHDPVSPNRNWSAISPRLSQIQWKKPTAEVVEPDYHSPTVSGTVHITCKF